MQPDIGAIQLPPVPTMSRLAAAACANDGLDPSTEVLQTTGVVPIHSWCTSQMQMKNMIKGK